MDIFLPAYIFCFTGDYISISVSPMYRFSRIYYFRIC